MALIPRKKNKEDEGFDISYDIKEPFSFSNFFETQVMDRARRFKALLADKGILFFLTSPFQARNRLVAQMLVLGLGIAFGVMPRASMLMSTMQNRAYTSEIDGLKQKSVGSLSIFPAASSNYNELHMLAFVINGSDLPSSASEYEVHLGVSYGAKDWKDVTYSWNVLPVNDSQRVLLVGIDQTKQGSGYGAFRLHIQLKGDKLESYEKTPYEITLSSAQETGPLYDKNGIHLSALTEAICGKGSIGEKQEEFEKELKEYSLALEQTEAMPVGLTVSPTTEEIEANCLAQRIYRPLTDTSTTDDILAMDQVDVVPEFDIGVVLTSDLGVEYDEEFVSSLEESGQTSEADALIFDALEKMTAAKDSVISAMNSVNSATLGWYNSLASFKLVLGQEISADAFPYFARCTNNIETDIEFIDKPEPDKKKDPGETAEPGETTAPEESGSPNETENPDETSEPDGTAEPETTSAPETTDALDAGMGG